VLELVLPTLRHHLPLLLLLLPQVTVLRLDAKGSVQKPASITPTGAPGALLPPPSLSGAYLEVQDQGLAAGLPLNPGASLALPVRVVVGKPQGSYDGSTLQVCI
jgi:hypothetical protein